MLRHESGNPKTKEGTSGADTIRVRPDELARAIAIIEARHQEEARRQEAESGTIPLGEAVTDLMLDATPEELWDEIQKQRQAEVKRLSVISKPLETLRPSVRPTEIRREEAPPLKTLKDETWEPSTRGPISLIVIVLVVIIVLGFVSNLPAPPVQLPGSYRETATIDEKPADPAYVRAMTGSDRVPLPVPIVTQEQILYDLPDNTPHSCTLFEVNYAYPKWIRWKSPPLPGQSVPQWTVIKHNGSPYLQGWIPRAGSQQIKQGSNITLFNSPGAPNLGRHPMPIQLRIISTGQHTHCFQSAPCLGQSRSS